MKENEQLQAEKEDFRLDFNRVVKKFNGKLEDYNKLEKEHKDLKAHTRDLKLELTGTYLSAKEFIKEHTKDAKGFKMAFKTFVDKVKEKTSMVREKSDLEPKVTNFEQTHKNEIKREKDNELSR